MALLGNIIWFVLGGWILFLVYGFASIVFFPAFVPLFRLAVYAAWPFNRGIVTAKQLRDYRELRGATIDQSETQKALEGVSSVLNVVWLLTFGWIIAALHLFASIANLCLCFLVVTIPNIAGNWKLIPVAFMPFNKVIVPKSIEEEIKLALTKSKLGI
jgi:uncharacterized membrane protein YccF (DUF307 family)